MARKPMVTRTMISTKVNVLIVNTNEKNTEEREVRIPRKQVDEKKILKAVQDQLPEYEKAVSVVSTSFEECRYGMDEAEFLIYAKKLDAKEAAEAEMEEN